MIYYKNKVGSPEWIKKALIEELEDEGEQKMKYPISEHRWLSVAEMAEKDVRITKLEAALDATWEALDGLYGADAGEKLPIELLPEDRRRLFDKALVMVGDAIREDDPYPRRVLVAKQKAENKALHEALAKCTERREKLEAENNILKQLADRLAAHECSEAEVEF